MIRFDPHFRKITFSNAFFVSGILAAILIVLTWDSQLALKSSGFSFLFSESWNPVTEKFGAAAPIYGTLMTSTLALLIAVPAAFCVAIFLTEIAPPWMARSCGIAIELLAGIPSIIFGMWGLFIMVPFLRTFVQPFLIDHLGDLPLIGPMFGGPAYGIGVFTASLVLAIMVLPYIAAFMRDIFLTVPDVLKESAYAMGATTWDVVRHIVVPSTRAGILGGVMIGLGRAIGETMAVTFVIGNAHRISASIMASGTTISATIANEFNEATGDLYTASLVELGLILFVITFIVLALGKLFLLSVEREVKA